MCFTLCLGYLYVCWGSIRHRYHAYCLSMVCLTFRRAVVVVLGPPGARAAPQGAGTRKWRGVTPETDPLRPRQSRGQPALRRRSKIRVIVSVEPWLCLESSGFSGGTLGRARCELCCCTAWMGTAAWREGRGRQRCYRLPCFRDL